MTRAPVRASACVHLQVLLFYAPQMEGMAKQIAKVSQTIQLCHVRCDFPSMTPACSTCGERLLACHTARALRAQPGACVDVFSTARRYSCIRTGKWTCTPTRTRTGRGV